MYSASTLLPSTYSPISTTSFDLFVRASSLLAFCSSFGETHRVCSTMTNTVCVCVCVLNSRSNPIHFSGTYSLPPARNKRDKVNNRETEKTHKHGVAALNIFWATQASIARELPLNRPPLPSTPFAPHHLIWWTQSRYGRRTTYFTASPGFYSWRETAGGRGRTMAP